MKISLLATCAVACLVLVQVSDCLPHYYTHTMSRGFPYLKTYHRELLPNMPLTMYPEKTEVIVIGSPDQPRHHHHHHHHFHKHGHDHGVSSMISSRHHHFVSVHPHIHIGDHSVEYDHVISHHPDPEKPRKSGYKIGPLSNYIRKRNRDPEDDEEKSRAVLDNYFPKNGGITYSSERFYEEPSTQLEERQMKKPMDSLELLPMKNLNLSIRDLI